MLRFLASAVQIAKPVMGKIRSHRMLLLFASIHVNLPNFQIESVVGSAFRVEAVQDEDLGILRRSNIDEFQGQNSSKLQGSVIMSP
jgi:hypothetical protein